MFTKTEFLAAMKEQFMRGLSMGVQSCTKPA